MELITLLGLAAGTLTTLGMVPQVIKLIKMKETRDISLLMFILTSTGVLLWLVYGLLIMDPPLIIANIITLGLALTILTLKLKYG